MLGNHFFIPYGNKIHYDFQHTYIWKHNDQGKTSDVHMFIAPQTVAYINYYRKQDSVARDLQIKKFDGNDLVFMLKAKTAKCIGPSNHWRLKNYEIRTFDGLNETIFIDKKNPLDTTLNITPADFVEYVNQKEMMSTSELLEFISNQKKAWSRKYQNLRSSASQKDLGACFYHYFDDYRNGCCGAESAWRDGFAFSDGCWAGSYLYLPVQVFKHFCY